MLKACPYRMRFKPCTSRSIMTHERDLFFLAPSPPDKSAFRVLTSFFHWLFKSGKASTAVLVVLQCSGNCANTDSFSARNISHEQ